jgi:hypothetical protein
VDEVKKKEENPVILSVIYIHIYIHTYIYIYIYTHHGQNPSKNLPNNRCPCNTTDVVHFWTCYTLTVYFTRWPKMAALQNWHWDAIKHLAPHLWRVLYEYSWCLTMPVLCFNGSDTVHHGHRPLYDLVAASPQIQGCTNRPTSCLCCVMKTCAGWRYSSIRSHPKRRSAQRKGWRLSKKQREENVVVVIVEQQQQYWWRR